MNSLPLFDLKKRDKEPIINTKNKSLILSLIFEDINKIKKVIKYNINAIKTALDKVNNIIKKLIIIIIAEKYLQYFVKYLNEYILKGILKKSMDASKFLFVITETALDKLKIIEVLSLLFLII
tara:strand:- start:545 stop:913 length:369 start_codon:yes stop_codon:yes gene_type:complete